MSRAFVSEAAAEANAGSLPERPVSAAANLVSPRGLALIEAEVTRLTTEHAEAEPEAREAIARDLRYWQSRRASAQLMPPILGKPDEVAFGTRVTLRRGRDTLTYTIVGEDEADPAQGLLGWTSPVAEALIGARAKETVEVGGGRPALTVTKIERAAQ